MSREDGRCPFCGTYLDPSSPICPSCGRNFFQIHIGNPSGEKISQRPPSIALTPKNLIIGGIIVLLIAIVPIIAFLSLVRNGNSQPTLIVKTIVVHDQTTQAPTIVPTQQFPTPTPPTPTAVSQSAGAVVCQADWSTGMNGWIGTSDWKTLNGLLINDGTNAGSQDPPTLLAPCNLNSVPNYKVEVKVQMQSQGSDPGFGFYVRYRPDSNSGYMVGNTTAYGGCGSVCTLSIAPTSDFRAPIENINFVPGVAMRTYTIEVKDNHIKVSIDGGFVTDVTDNRSLSGGSVGFWDKDVQLTVSSFKVTSL